MQKISVNITEILKKLGIESLNEMQNASILANKNSKDVVLLSPTGSGKTLGFLLPLLQKLNPKKEGIQAMVLAPSRELALQIEQVFRSLGTGYKVNCCYGGHSMRTEKNNLLHPPTLLVGTPGRIADHIRRENIDTTSIHSLVLDEFDKALELGFEREMRFILSQIPNLSKRILTSATQALEIPDFTRISNPEVLNYLGNTIPKALQLKAVEAEGRDKLEALFRLICKLGNSSTLVFCNHRDAVERISELLADKGLAHDIFHGGMKQEDRERALIKFRNGSHHLLITTDLASRGLDIPEIEHVIHYQLPSKEDAFIHRNGRTARMHASGSAYLVLGQGEPAPDFIDEELNFEELPADISIPQQPEWITLYIDSGKKDKINKVDIVGLLFKKGKLEKDELGKIEVLDYSSFAAVKRKKANKVVQLLRNERIKRKKLRILISK